MAAEAAFEEGLLPRDLQGGQTLARISQPRSQRERRGSEDHKLPCAQAESVAQRHRTQVGRRQAKSGRALQVAGSL